MKDFSLQLYSLREVPTLRQRMEIAAQAGYTGVEFAGYDGIAGPEMRRLLASLGLRGTGSHIAYDALRDDLDGCVRYCLEAGITSAACPGCEMNDRDQALAQAEFLEACAERFGADKVIMPEKDMGIRLARSLSSNNLIDYMDLSAKHSLMELEAIDEWVGRTLKQSNIRNRYKINVVAIRSGKVLRVAPGSDDIIHDGDVLVVIGENTDLERVNKLGKR